MYCGAYCLQFVARRDGLRLSRRRAAALGGTTRNGTRPDGMVGALLALGYRRARLRERLKWHELRRLAKNKRAVIIVSWWSDLDAGDRYPKALPADGHWSVVTQITADAITLYDPDAPQPRTLPRIFFEARWYDYDIAPDGARYDLQRAAVVAYAPVKHAKRAAAG